MEMKFSQRLEPRIEQTLELILSPQMIQALKILNLPYTELIEQIEREAEENVALDVERKDELFEYIKYITSDKKVKKEADFSELPGLENIGDTSRNLTDHLLGQLQLEDLDSPYKEIIETLIQNVDDRGYLTTYTEVREKLMKDLDVSRPTVDKALKILQSFEPDGVGARNIKECLLIQIHEYNFEHEELKEILEKAVSKCLEDIGKKKYEKVAKELEIQADGVVRIAEFIKENLNPSPGSYFQAEAKHVIPSFSIEKQGNKFKLINLEKSYGPVIKLNPQYIKMFEDPKTDSETKEFLKKKVEAAKALMENLSKRFETGEKIMQIVLKTQEVFFDKGIVWIKPLMQKDIASELGLNPSTISRAVAEKHVQTPQGLYPIKFLCPRTNKGTAVPRIKALIAGIIAEEDKKKPLSDDEIKNILNKEGIKIERRTVALYREELRLPSSLDRKK